jgi:hypothetical protein
MNRFSRIATLVVRGRDMSAASCTGGVVSDCRVFLAVRVYMWGPSVVPCCHRTHERRFR